jgi:ABC-type multidrug transport system ATPase subunit
MTPLVELRGIGKRYGRIVALREIDLAIAPGEIWGLVGPNGAGKSTLLKLLCGLQRPDEGGFLWRGAPADPGEPAFREQLGFAPERPALYPRWTVRENLTYLAALQGEAGPSEQAAQALGLEPLYERPAGELSRGQLQRAVLAAALIGEPPLLLLDEPHGGLDFELLDALAALVRAHAARGGAVLMSSHVWSEVAGSCTHVAALQGGRIEGQGPLAEIGPLLLRRREAA